VVIEPYRAWASEARYARQRAAPLLLRPLPGSAITEVEIDGVLHE